MKITEVLGIVTSVAPYVFGAGGTLAYLSERSKRKANALQGMQTAYDDFVKDARNIIDGLKIELSEVKTELKQVHKENRELKKDFSDYKKQHQHQEQI